MQQTLKFYQSFLLDPNLLANGHTLIKAFLLQNQTHRQHTLLNLLSSSPPILALVGNVYPCDVFPQLSQQQKQKTRMFLMQTLWGIISKNGIKAKQASSLLSMINKIHNQQGYDKWLSYYADIIKNIPKQQFADFIISILQRADNRISILSINIFSFIMQQSAEFKFPASTLLQIFYLCIKNFAHLYNTDDATLEQYYDAHQQYLVDFVWNNLNSSTICMKYGLKILTILYGDMNRLQQQDSQKQISKINVLLELGVQLTQQYLKIIQNPNYGGLIEQQQEDVYTQVQKQNSTMQLYQNLPIILYQYLQLFSIIIPGLQQLQSQKHKPDCSPILICSILLTLSSKSQVNFWSNHTDHYFMSIEDQFEKNLRNRATSMICSLIQDSENKRKYLKIMEEYFSIVGQAIINGPVNGVITVKNYLNSKLITSNKLTLASTEINNIQQSAYFILTSSISSMFPGSQIPSLLQYLSNRYIASSSILTKIIVLYIIINQLGSSKAAHDIQSSLSAFILENINNDKSLYTGRKQDSGIMLVLARGLGKICYKAKIKVQIGVTIPIQFIQLMIRYIANGDQSANRPDQDGTYIVLEVLMKLSQSHPNNKSILAQFITPQLQYFMINNYMHDGLLSTIVIKLFELYPYPQTINNLASALLTGNINEEKYSILIAHFIRQSLLTLTQDHLKLMLTHYKTRLSIISPIVLLYLTTLLNNSIKPSQAFVQLLNSNYDQIWLVPMLRCGILKNQYECISRCIRNITEQVTSQYQLQRKMMIVFYLGILQTQKLITILKNTNLYDRFIEKVVRYARLFQGQNLKTIGSVFLIKIAQVDKNYISRISEILQLYGKVQISQWEDEEENGQQQMDQIEKLMEGKMENEELQKQLQQVFADLLNQKTTQYIETAKAQLRAKLSN